MDDCATIRPSRSVWPFPSSLRSEGCHQVAAAPALGYAQLPAVWTGRYLELRVHLLRVVSVVFWLELVLCNSRRAPIPGLRFKLRHHWLTTSLSPHRDLRFKPRCSGSSSCSSAVISREFSISTVKSKHGFTHRLQIIAPPLNHKSSIAVLRRHHDHLSRRGGCRNRHNQVSPSGFRSGEEKLVSFNGGFFNIAKPVPDLLNTFNSEPDFGI
ncbi:hypothetical protein F2Q69_00009797 [Brassica cretica]|uniref:Uncharacterized protein n=1 Tax=Brassica cretica TaxID=69181 RepID=A0A8S9P4V4_BRACR|nr:hypothetical protein F2Q69_00009797 [Brassica cretica]